MFACYTYLLVSKVAFEFFNVDDFIFVDINFAKLGLQFVPQLIIQPIFVYYFLHRLWILKTFIHWLSHVGARVAKVMDSARWNYIILVHFKYCINLSIKDTENP